ncbi:MAG: hypothetical protein IT429_03135, partial [Gemmataceae bacterium]|nr:hypothetical protein [Gemmataceae bacterium]
TDLYYDPTWPNGAIYLWPVPTQAYGLDLRTRVLLDAVTLSSTFSLPPGYQDAITLTLAESLASAYVRPIAASLAQAALAARARIQANNDVTPTLQTQDSGMPGYGSGMDSNFNYRTGMLTP